MRTRDVAIVALLLAFAAEAALFVYAGRPFNDEGVYLAAADLVYDGRWFTGVREDMDALVNSAMRYTTGDVRVKLYKGTATVTGRRSPVLWS